MDAHAPAIRLKGVRVHNLRNVDVDIPRGKLTAICGVSGSGKTSLALDTLYAEGQRRYIESFSAYTRQFLDRLEKPDFDSIEGLPPALAVTRGGSSKGNRSTVGTSSETLDYLRLLFAHLSQLVCYQCQQPVERKSPGSLARWIEESPDVRMMIAFATTWSDVGERAAILADLQSAGFLRLISEGKTLHLGSDSREELAQSLPADGEAWVVVDRIKGGSEASRTTESLETAFEHGHGEVLVLSEGDSDVAEEIDGRPWRAQRFHQRLVCTRCDIEYPDPSTQLFSFNSPLGACSECEGFGNVVDLDLDHIVPIPTKTLREGAIAPWNSPAYEHNLDELLDVADELDIPVDVPFNRLKKRHRKIILEGDETVGFEGLRGFFRWLERKKYKMHVRVFLARWRTYRTCPACNGNRLRPEALAFQLGQRSFAEVCDLQVEQLASELESLTLSSTEQRVAAVPLEQTVSRLNYLKSVGLGYLQLSRPLRTLSGGEAQRCALTAALGSSLVNMLYVLDEPSVGLHPHDVSRLAKSVKQLCRRGNSVVIVEHEEALLGEADWLIEMGPAAGSQGGRVVAQGATDDTSQLGGLTAEYLTGQRQVPVPSRRRQSKKNIRLLGCTGNNLKSVDVDIPLNLLCVVAGVSGSGKSSLIQDTLYGALRNRLTQTRESTLPFDSILGSGQIDDCILVDQSPASRSPRSNPVTFIKAFDEIRAAFAATVDAKTRNLTAGHFSFNSDAGRCSECRGDGSLQIDMQFLADVRMTCPSCQGKRYRHDILKIRYRDRSISDVLEMTARDAISFFRGTPKVQQKLQVLLDVGLDYVQLGQPCSTLSSGEGQRLKLAGFLASATKKKTLFLLDEPTTGLHMHDIVRLLDCFDALIEGGHSLVVVEHNLHVMAAADHVIELGPGAAEQGGSVVFQGPPEKMLACKSSLTAGYLKELLSD